MKDVFLDFKLTDKPILICGKGPSLDDYNPSMRDNYYVIGINEVADYVPVDMTFVIHAEHIKDRPTCAPYFPHIGKSVGPLSLDIHAYHYNLNTASKSYRLTPIITQDGFTIHALLDVLGHLGAKKIRTLGVDGGLDYARILTNVPKRTSKTPFDLQDDFINKLVLKYNFDYQPFGNKAGHREDTTVSLLKTSRLNKE